MPDGRLAAGDPLRHFRERDDRTASPEFDATYAWKMGGRLRITLHDGRILDQTVHGQKGSMHARLTRAEIDAKFSSLTHFTDAAVLRTVQERRVRDLPRALTATTEQWG